MQAQQPEQHAIPAGLLSALGEQIADAVRRATSIPAEKRLVGRDWLMEYFGIKATALDKIIAMPSFPAAIKIPSGPLRWKASEVMEWAERQHGTRREATSRLSKKVDVLTLARITGHKDIRMLMIYYQTDMADVARQIG